MCYLLLFCLTLSTKWICSVNEHVDKVCHLFVRHWSSNRFPYTSQIASNTHPCEAISYENSKRKYWPRAKNRLNRTNKKTNLQKHSTTIECEKERHGRATFIHFILWLLIGSRSVWTMYGLMRMHGVR